MALKKFEGEWEELTAKHLLNRATFTVTKASISKFTEQGLEASVDELLQELPLPLPPVNPGYHIDPNVPIGETWIDKPEGEGTPTLWSRSLKAWVFKNMIQEGYSAREKMTLFWHNHFVSAPALDPIKYRYQYLDILRKYCFGNVKELSKEISISASMLFFLNGNKNTAEAPNENFARELFELFTVGKGPIVAPGDYSTFTETDVLEASKILTGWTTDYQAELPLMPKPKFNEDLHDKSSKQLSHYFNNAVIDDEGELEYETLIDIIFESNNTALNIVREIYIWFVHYEIDEIVESEIIAPLAELFKASNYDIKPVLKSLFESEHFYDPSAFGSKIKSPLELMIGFNNTFNIPISNLIDDEFRVHYALTFICEDMGQAVYKHPTVAGWKAYYQSPNFYRTWIDSITLPLRMSYLEKAITTGHTLISNLYQVNALDFALNSENPSDPNELISDIANIIYSNPISDNQLERFKNILIPGLPDFEWTTEYSDYIANPLNEEKKIAVENRLKSLLVSMLTSPDYQLH